MRISQRSLQTFYYRLYSSNSDIETTDEWGNTVYTGDKSVSYGDPVEMSASISPASGSSITEQFGNLDNYDKVIVTGDMSCPIDENTILYIDTEPEQDSETEEWSAHDYVVRRVAKSVNYISIAVRKVSVS